MKNWIRLPLFAALMFVLGGCASYFKRKECESTNWYQHGHNVAMAGKRLDADDFVRQCKEAEAKIGFADMDTGFKAGMSKYCTGDNIFAVGKAGKPFSYDMCDGENEKKMRARYNAGVREFCVPANGYHFGSSGGVYQNVCPKDQESAWLVEFRRGRKVYLTVMIEEKNRESERLTTEIMSLEAQRTSLQMQHAALSGRTVIRSEQIYDPKTRTYRTQVAQVVDEDSKRRSQNLESEISSINYKINSTRQRQETLSTEVSKMRAEVVTL